MMSSGGLSTLPVPEPLFEPGFIIPRVHGKPITTEVRQEIESAFRSNKIMPTSTRPAYEALLASGQKTAENPWFAGSSIGDVHVMAWGRADTA